VHFLDFFYHFVAFRFLYIDPPHNKKGIFKRPQLLLFPTQLPFFFDFSPSSKFDRDLFSPSPRFA